MYIGKNIKVYVNTIDPSEAKKLSYVTVLFPLGMAIILILAGLAMVLPDNGKKYIYKH